VPDRLYDDVAAWRALSSAVRLSWRTDPSRTASRFAMSVLQSVGFALEPIGIRLLVDAAVRHDGAAAVRAVLLVAALHGLGLVGDWYGFMIGMRMRESIVAAVDLRIIELTTGIAGIEHLERADYADELLLLRNERDLFASIMDSVAQNFAVFASVATTIALLATIHPALILLPVFGLPALWTGARAAKIQQAASDEMAEQLRIRNFTYGLVANPVAAKELRVFGLGNELTGRYDRSVVELRRIQFRAQLLSTVWTTLGWLTFSAGYGGAIAFVVVRAVNGEASLGQVVLALTLAATVNGHVSSGVAVVQWLLATLRNGRRLVWLEDYARDRERELRSDEPAPIPATLRQGIVVEDVTFTYPGTDRVVLDKVSLVLPAGATVAVVGDNGAGKTTLVKLVSRMYQPTQGRILVDGVDLRRFPVRDWRARMAAGFQDFARYELIASETVGVGDLPHIDDADRIARSLRRASAGELVDDLPEGLATLLGKSFDGGVELSGGQWQKLALGRAMMRSTPLLLVLDEPTAALDAATEHALFERFTDAAHRAGDEAGTITLIVSHRFSTVRMADLIVVIDGGRVAEAGTHDELMASRGIYAELYTMQATAYR
jgi:ABC-type multidrug transport system fused ATPase/permease subunit